MRFDWDDANTTHLAAHGVAPEEFEQAFRKIRFRLYRTMRLPEGGMTLARAIAAKRGLRYQTYLKTVIHSALQSEAKRLLKPGRGKRRLVPGRG